MVNNIVAPISLGELLDKITILEIKSENITDERKLVNIHNELAMLRATLSGLNLSKLDEVADLQARLKGVNSEIWDAEDVIRDFDRNGDFGEGFIKVARSIYRLNDARADIKKNINLLCGSSVVEEKGYTPY